MTLELTVQEKAALEMLMAAGVCNIGAQIAQGGFAAIENGQASALLSMAVTLRKKLQEKPPEAETE